MDLFPYLSGSLQKSLVNYYESQKTNPNVKPPQKYDLYAASNHYGGLNGGHYTAIARNMARKAWYNYDDSRVTEVCSLGDTATENQSIKTRAAYSLFYVSWAPPS